MNKDLKAFRKICKNLNSYEFTDEYKKGKKLIENALREKEQQDGVFKILKEVIEFAHMLPLIEPNGDNGFNLISGISINMQRSIENKEQELLREWVLETCFPKELKALEIIKREPSMVCWQAGYENYEEYLDNTPEQERFIKNKEEYDLLKEVLL